MLQIISAQDSKLPEFLSLANDYVSWMLSEIPEHFPELDVDTFAAEHSYDDLSKKFPGDHVTPHGCLLVAMVDERAAGCIALGKLDDSICEVRTLYVRPEFRGVGAGRALVDAVFKKAREYGYQMARLDTLEFMIGAQKLYESYGFYRIDPYLPLPDHLKPYIRFYEMRL
ncbi:MAG: GNAT family N-acetyltransferase [Chloroflexota bacterium]